MSDLPRQRPSACLLQAGEHRPDPKLFLQFLWVLHRARHCLGFFLVWGWGEMRGRLRGMKKYQKEHWEGRERNLEELGGMGRERKAWAACLP